MLQKAIEAEVQEFLQQHDDRRDEHGNRLVVRNGHKPSRKIVTGAGALAVQQPRVRDKSPHKEQRVQFSSAILPPYLRRSKAIEEFIPWLYLKGISTGVPGRTRKARQLAKVGFCAVARGYSPISFAVSPPASGSRRTDVSSALASAWPPMRPGPGKGC